MQPLPASSQSISASLDQNAAASSSAQSSRLNNGYNISFDFRDQSLMVAFHINDYYIRLLSSVDEKKYPEWSEDTNERPLRDFENMLCYREVFESQSHREALEETSYLYESSNRNFAIPLVSNIRAVHYKVEVLFPKIEEREEKQVDITCCVLMDDEIVKEPLNLGSMPLNYADRATAKVPVLYYKKELLENGEDLDQSSNDASSSSSGARRMQTCAQTIRDLIVPRSIKVVLAQPRGLVPCAVNVTSYFEISPFNTSLSTAATNKSHKRSRADGDAEA